MVALINYTNFYEFDVFSAILSSKLISNKWLSSWLYIFYYDRLIMNEA